MTSITDREYALAYFERQLKLAYRFNDPDVDHIQEAIYALRRSLDHTAIQMKLNAAMSCLRELYRIQPDAALRTEFWTKVGLLLGNDQ